MLGLYLCFNDTATTEIYTLSLHDALPICEADDHDDAAQQSGHDEAPAYRGDSQDHGPVQDEHAEAERQDGERKREPDHKRPYERVEEPDNCTCDERRPEARHLDAGEEQAE